MARVGQLILALSAAALVIPGATMAQKGGLGFFPGPPKTAAPVQTVDNRAARAPPSAFKALRAEADRNGAVRAIIGLQTRQVPEGALAAASRRAQRSRIDRTREDLLQSLKGTRFEVVHTYDSVPLVALKLSPGALERLERSRRAAAVYEDKRLRPALADSRPLVEATESAIVDRAGEGQHVAILDSGVEKTHSYLQQTGGGSKVVSEACYSVLAQCPNQATEDTATGSGEPCTGSNCDHGTFIAGIVAASGTNFSGVAPDAKLISIRVFTRFPPGKDPVKDPGGLGVNNSDLIKGLERVNALSSSRDIAAVNLSIGGAKSTANCDSTDPTKPIIDTLRSKGIATIAASGNDGFSDGVAGPSCISTAVTVGSTTKTDVRSSFSNSSPLVELLAPGSSIRSTVPSNTFTTSQGTSFAAPHVAAAWAVLKGISPQANVPTVLSALQSTGKPITDSRNNVTRPRIRVLAAGTRLADTGLLREFVTSGTGLDMASDGVGLRGKASGTITIAGIPAGATLVSTKLIWTTIGGPDASVVLNGAPRAGILAGASRDTCWRINQLGPNRTYYANVGPLGNGNWSVSGVGGVGGAQAQGASLVTIYRKSSGGVGRVYQRVGALSSPTNAAVPVPIVTTGNGAHVRFPSLHVAVGDGQPFTEEALRYGNIAITDPNFFSGAEGPYWDNAELALSPNLVPAGNVVRTLLLKGQQDCLVLSSAALSQETSG